VKTVSEYLSGDPFDPAAKHLTRSEELLFTKPSPGTMRFLGPGLAPLAVYSFPTTYQPSEFSPPKGVFEGPTLRLEWQTINGRQPFYHRNADVDEIGYQVAGERTLLTEHGVVEFGLGQFCCIPTGVAHDNYGRADIHLIFYLEGPAKPVVAATKSGQPLIPPFDGWEARPWVEALTNNMGAPGGVIGYSVVDEELLLGLANRVEDRLQVIEGTGKPGEIEWLYTAPKVWIGQTVLEQVATRDYRRRLCADEIQYQVEGVRTIVSQRGVVTLQPGDFTCIPRGCAFAELADARSVHLSLVTAETVPAVTPPTRFADEDVLGWIARADANAGDVK
jgi:uncharacterized cupin superfamily protein